MDRPLRYTKQEKSEKMKHEREEDDGYDVTDREMDYWFDDREGK